MSIADDVKFLRDATGGCTGPKVGAILRVCAVAEEAMADGFLCGHIAGLPRFEGGCGEKVLKQEAYRCADCTASFHRDCIRKHFASRE